MTEIEVDFNSRGAQGTVRGSLSRAGSVLVGQRVTLIDSSEEDRFEATVQSIDSINGRVYYDVDWEPANGLSFAPTNAFFGSKIALSTVGEMPNFRFSNPDFRFQHPFSTAALARQA